MLSSLMNFFRKKPEVNFKQMVHEGALILDVRSKSEFASGHCPDAINIPVEELGRQLSKIGNKDQCIICCCASGVRSGTAVRLLKSKGYTAVYNGSGWKSLKEKI